MNKTIESWLHDLPDPVRSAVMRITSGSSRATMVHNLPSAFFCACHWNSCVEYRVCDLHSRYCALLDTGDDDGFLPRPDTYPEPRTR